MHLKTVTLAADEIDDVDDDNDDALLQLQNDKINSNANNARETNSNEHESEYPSAT
jgi:uncharacterized protein (UPF0210 family)